jgi:hypothetical protein
MTNSYSLTTQKTWAETEGEIRDALTKWGCDTYSLSRPGVDADVKQIRASNLYQTPEQAAVRLVANWKSGRKLDLTYNQQARAVDNARVLYLAIDAMRLNEKRGIDKLMREAYLQLSAPEAAHVSRDPFDVLGLQRGASADEIEAMYRVKAKKAHPDNGGSNAAMAALNDARERALKETHD